MVEVRVQGELDLRTVPQMSERLNDALSIQPVHLVIDLEDCDFLDALGISMLLDIHRKARRQQARLSLRGCSPRQLRLLALMGVHHAFEIEVRADPAAART